MKACLYEALEDQVVRCDLCHHRCLIKPGHKGICQVRFNDEGRLVSMVYGRLIARHVDPIEKKPLFHFSPGSRAYSIATVGCNFRCRFCQNADIAQMPRDRDGLILGTAFTPRDIVDDAIAKGCSSIAYTYTEPTVFFEFAMDTANLAKTEGLKNVFVTNGYMTAEALNMAAPCLDGANVDLKAFSDDFYKKYCGASLDPVKATLKRLKAMGVLLEVTTLIIPGLNDNPRELSELARFIAGDLGPETPWHISRFHPTYRLTDRSSTPVNTLSLAHDIGKKAGLQYVYIGNVFTEKGENTWCANCSALLIERWGYTVRLNHIVEGRCPICEAPVYGVGMSDDAWEG